MPGGNIVAAADEGFELHLEDDPESPPLHRAICAACPRRVLGALRQGTVDVHQRHGHTHYTYLHLLLMVCEPSRESSVVTIVYQLSNAGADVNASDSEGTTPLQLAISKQLHHIMVALIRCGVDLCERDYKALVRDVDSPYETDMLSIIDKYDPGLWAAVAAGSTGMVSLLVNSWCRVNVERRLGSRRLTLLGYARLTGQPAELLSVLEDYLVSIEFVHATLAGDERRMQQLLMDSRPCDPHIMDISYQPGWDEPLQPRSLRDAALEGGHTHVLHLLPDADYDEDTPPPGGGGGGGGGEGGEGASASCSEYSSGSNADSCHKAELPVVVGDGRFTPRLSTFSSRPVTTESADRHYVQGFYYHEPERDDIEEYVFKLDRTMLKASSPQGTLRGKKRHGFHDYSHNWNEVDDKPRKSGKNKHKNGKSKTCVIS